MAHQAIPEEEPPDPQPDFMKFCKTNFPSEPGRFPVLYYDQELLTKTSQHDTAGLPPEAVLNLPYQETRNFNLGAVTDIPDSHSLCPT